VGRTSWSAAGLPAGLPPNFVLSQYVTSPAKTPSKPIAAFREIVTIFIHAPGNELLDACGRLSCMTVQSKLDELRFKTDRQLIQLANRELDLGIRDAHEALESAENWASAEQHYRLAGRAYAQAVRLIRLASDVPDDELTNVELRLGHLREVLAALSATSATPAEDQIAALARALWKARGCPVGLPEQDWFRAERALKSHAACVVS
jgi:hypothetical protein